MGQETPDQEKKLFLLDAYALIFRAYFAFAKNPRVTSGGLDTSAVYGFTSALLDLLMGNAKRHLAKATGLKCRDEGGLSIYRL